uniref:Uncharacterized protein n=1 Tax=Phakopsora pachyrhizi TaxID=170000 RepID=A0A0S1MIX0_PHAPC
MSHKFYSLLLGISLPLVGGKYMWGSRCCPFFLSLFLAGM